MHRLSFYVSLAHRAGTQARINRTRTTDRDPQLSMPTSLPKHSFSWTVWELDKTFFS